ncbi:MAG: DUF2442 domain-containing protein [Verrucomicrobiales bacterium]|jgi:hypothetical protein|nr:DUF2442 domain-containing protein [Verrucomicrobiales bacterium]
MKLVEAKPLNDYRLFLRYPDGTAGVVDLSPLVGRGLFAAWLQPGVFEQVTISEDGAPVWAGEIDLCPDALYLQLTGRRPEEIFPNLNVSFVHA